MPRGRVGEHLRVVNVGRAELLAAAELITREAEAEARRQPVPGVTSFYKAAVHLTGAHYDPPSRYSGKR